MNVYVTLEHRFYLYKNNLYTDGAFDQKFWKRYLNIFETVTIVARAKTILNLDSKLQQVNSDVINFHAIPFYIGLKDTLLKKGKVKESLKKISNDKKSAFILRVGSPIADTLSPMLRANSIDYAVEVVGDPWDVFAPGAFDSKLRSIMRLYFSWKLRRQCLNAKYSSYVTQFALQKRYPSPNAIVSIHASSIELKEDYFFKRNKDALNEKKWIFVGTLEQYQKAPDILIKAFNQISDPSISLTIVGDGRMREELESMCTNPNVHFLGKLKTSAQVRLHLMDHSFFVLPSRGEGLPRAMIEAMSCSCIAVGSDIGGIKELIEEKFIVKAGAIEALRKKIIDISSLDSETLFKESKKNYQVATKYLIEDLEIRRNYFYNSIKVGVTNR